MEIMQAKEKEDFLKCWKVVRELRPHLTEETYLTSILYMLDEGYTMLYVEEAGEVLAFCGFRRMTMLYSGRVIYIDDLATLPEARGKGCATKLLDQVVEIARNEDLEAVHLDSAHYRFDAHRLYLKYGFNISSHHFMKKLDRQQSNTVII